MKKNNFYIKTKRLNVFPLTDMEIRDLIDSCQDEGLAMAYSQMLEGCKNDPDNRHWYAPWTMETKSEKKRIGTLGFKGPAAANCVEIGYGIDKEFEGQGFTTEAAKALIEWAFDNENVMFVEAEADEHNAASIHILEKLGFKQYGYGEEGPRFYKEKTETNYTALGISLGLCFGLSIGMVLFDNMTFGMCIGMMLGICLGSSKDKQYKSKMAEMKKERYGL